MSLSPKLQTKRSAGKWCLPKTGKTNADQFTLSDHDIDDSWSIPQASKKQTNKCGSVAGGMYKSNSIQNGISKSSTDFIKPVHGDKGGQVQINAEPKNIQISMNSSRCTMSTSSPYHGKQKNLNPFNGEKSLSTRCALITSTPCHGKDKIFVADMSDIVTPMDMPNEERTISSPVHSSDTQISLRVNKRHALPLSEEEFDKLLPTDKKRSRVIFTKDTQVKDNPADATRQYAGGKYMYHKIKSTEFSADGVDSWTAAETFLSNAPPNTKIVSPPKCLEKENANLSALTKSQTGENKNQKSKTFAELNRNPLKRDKSGLKQLDQNVDSQTNNLVLGAAAVTNDQNLESQNYDCRLLESIQSRESTTQDLYHKPDAPARVQKNFNVPQTCGQSSGDNQVASNEVKDSKSNPCEKEESKKTQSNSSSQEKVILMKQKFANQKAKNKNHEASILIEKQPEEHDESGSIGNVQSTFNEMGHEVATNTYIKQNLVSELFGANVPLATNEEHSSEDSGNSSSSDESQLFVCRDPKDVPNKSIHTTDNMKEKVECDGYQSLEMESSSEEEEHYYKKLSSQKRKPRQRISRHGKQSSKNLAPLTENEGCSNKVHKENKKVKENTQQNSKFDKIQQSKELSTEEYHKGHCNMKDAGLKRCTKPSILRGDDQAQKLSLCQNLQNTSRAKVITSTPYPGREKVFQFEVSQIISPVELVSEERGTESMPVGKGVNQLYTAPPSENLFDKLSSLNKRRSMVTFVRGIAPLCVEENQAEDTSKDTGGKHTVYPKRTVSRCGAVEGEESSWVTTETVSSGTQPHLDIESPSKHMRKSYQDLTVTESLNGEDVNQKNKSTAKLQEIQLKKDDSGSKQLDKKLRSLEVASNQKNLGSQNFDCRLFESIQSRGSTTQDSYPKPDAPARVQENCNVPQTCGQSSGKNQIATFGMKVNNSIHHKKEKANKIQSQPSTQKKVVVKKQELSNQKASKEDHGASILMGKPEKPDINGSIGNVQNTSNEKGLEVTNNKCIKQNRVSEILGADGHVPFVTNEEHSSEDSGNSSSSDESQLFVCRDPKDVPNKSIHTTDNMKEKVECGGYQSLELQSSSEEEKYFKKLTSQKRKPPQRISRHGKQSSKTESPMKSDLKLGLRPKKRKIDIFDSSSELDIDDCPIQHVQRQKPSGRTRSRKYEEQHSTDSNVASKPINDAGLEFTKKQTTAENDDMNSIDEKKGHVDSGEKRRTVEKNLRMLKNPSLKNIKSNEVPKHELGVLDRCDKKQHVANKRLNSPRNNKLQNSKIDEITIGKRRKKMHLKKSGNINKARKHHSQEATSEDHTKETMRETQSQEESSRVGRPVRHRVPPALFWLGQRVEYTETGGAREFVKVTGIAASAKIDELQIPIKVQGSGIAKKLKKKTSKGLKSLKRKDVSENVEYLEKQSSKELQPVKKANVTISKRTSSADGFNPVRLSVCMKMLSSVSEDASSELRSGFLDKSLSSDVLVCKPEDIIMKNMSSRGLEENIGVQKAVCVSGCGLSGELVDLDAGASFGMCIALNYSMVLYVLEGAILFKSSRRKMQLCTGSFLIVNQGESYNIINVGTSKTKLIIMKNTD